MPTAFGIKCDGYERVSLSQKANSIGEHTNRIMDMLDKMTRRDCIKGRHRERRLHLGNKRNVRSR